MIKIKHINILITVIVMLLMVPTFVLADSTWTGTDTNGVASRNGSVGIGTATPPSKLTVAGGHYDTTLRLQSSGNGSDQPANLSLWASEPNWTTYGTGIGYNVNGSPYYGRIDSTRGSSFIRFLPDMTSFEFQNTNNSYIQNTLVVKNNGNVGIGTTTPSTKLTVAGGHTDTTFKLQSSGNGSDQPANLSLWASEPNWTTYGTGIGYNVNGSPYYGRIDSARGASYIRFLPDRISFEFQNTSNEYTQNALIIKNDGKVGIGTLSPNTNLEVLNDNGAYLRLSSQAGGAFEDMGGIQWYQTFGEPGIAAKIWSKRGGGQYDQGDIRFLTNDGSSLQERMIINVGGYVGIGTATPQSMLAVNGTITAKEVNVTLTGWSDFVFEDNYNLLSLSHVESYIKENKHLPDIPSAKEVEKEGLSMAEMMKKQMQKIEELTLYVIEQNKRIESLEKELAGVKENRN
jgi:hypothetical protein